MEFAGKHIQSIRNLSQDSKDAYGEDCDNGNDPEALRGASQTLKDMDDLIKALQDRRKNSEQEEVHEYLQKLKDDGQEHDERPWKEAAAELSKRDDSIIDAENMRLENELERLRDIRKRQAAVEPKAMGGFQRVAKYGLTKKQLKSLQVDKSSTKTYEDEFIAPGGAKTKGMISGDETPESSPLEVPSAENCEAEGELEITKINSIVGELTSFADEISDALMKFDIVDNSGSGTNSGNGK